MPDPSPSKSTRIKTVLFDFMGTCLDWHSSITGALPASLDPDARSALALKWRHAYFDYNAARLQAGQVPEDFDTTVRHVLSSLLSSAAHAAHAPLFTPDATERAIAAWHAQPAWPEVRGAVEKLRELGYEVVMHANGTTRLQLDLVRSSGLRFDMLFSSEMLGYYKPAPENYMKALGLLRRKPEECVTVAAHTADLGGARRVGMKTVYVRRWTDDIAEDQEAIRRENDEYLENMEGLDSVIARL